MYDEDDDYTRLTQAILFAVMAHGTRTDKGGQPFIGHPLRVMAALAHPTANVNVLIAAVLHDTVEDEDITLEMIHRDFGEDVMWAVDALTRRSVAVQERHCADEHPILGSDGVHFCSGHAGETYFTYIKRCRLNNIATLVKQADIADNMNPQRLGFQYTLQLRYQRALELLREPSWLWERDEPDDRED